MSPILESCPTRNHARPMTHKPPGLTHVFNLPSILTAKERELYRRIPTESRYIPDSSFSCTDGEDRIFKRSSKVDVPRWTCFPVVPGPMPTRPARPGVLKPKDEATLFLRYNYARYRLNELSELQHDEPTLARAQSMVHWFRRVLEIRDDLVKANMPLVLMMAKNSKISNVEFGDLISEGNMALLRSVDRFDVSRGYKFSSYACKAILKSFSRLASKARRYRQLFPVEFNPELQSSDFEERKHQTQQEDSIEALREIIAYNRAQLTDVEHEVVTKRFAIGSGARPSPLTEVGKKVGLSKERIRQIQKAAMNKIRCALEEQAFVPSTAKS